MLGALSEATAQNRLFRFVRKGHELLPRGTALARRILAVSMGVEDKWLITITRELLSGGQVESVGEEIALLSCLTDLKFTLFL